MKRGALNFLGRKNQSLFDTNIKMKDMDNVELVLESSAIPESGTASVRARPTVKHHSSSSDSFHGFAVPTPTVPVLPPVNGPKTNGLVSADRLSNGSVISVPDLVEGEIFVPPPPSTAPPPPPANFIPPPPDFVDVLNSPDVATPQPPSMPAPKLTSATVSMEEEDLSMLKPPPMSPPRPPSTCSSGSASSTCSPPLDKVPEHPKFAPPQPPTERQSKTHKTPPPKPIRMSSVSSLDSPPQTPAPPPPVQTPTFSTFNPQNTAKLYTVPKSPLLGGYDGRDKRPKQMLLLEDTGSVSSVPVLVQVEGEAPKVTTKETTPSKPVSKDTQEPKKNLSITQLPQVPVPEPNKETKPETVSAKPETTTPVQPPPQKSPQLQTGSSTTVIPEPSRDKLKGSPSPSHKFSPLLDRKLRSLKGSESSGAREGPAASPLALLMAAKEREKNRSIPSLSREDSMKKNEQSSTSIPQSDSSPSSFTVIPRSTSSSSLTSTEERLQETSKSVLKSPTLEKPSSPAQVRNQIPSNGPVFSQSTVAEAPSVSNHVEQEQNTEESPSESLSAQLDNNKEDLNVPLLPPPPEFGDFDEITEPPPSILPPDPPVKNSLPPTISHVSRAPAPPPPPKPTPPPAPKLPPPDMNIKPKPQVQTKPKPASAPLPSTLSPSQATLLSILQKKMLEMDHKIAPVRDTESSSDDWGTPLSDEDNKVPVVPRAKPQTKSFPVVNKTATLDMRELESKVVKKYQATSSNNVPTSNGLQSKQQYGRTFTIRPGTKQPITLVNKEES